MAITSIDTLVRALSRGQRFRHSKSFVNNTARTAWVSGWTAPGTPTAGATPPARTAGSGYVPDATTTGALWPALASLAGSSNYLAQFVAAASGSIPQLIVLYDRIWHCSGFTANITSTQSVTTPGTLPAARAPLNGADCEVWTECYTAGGATASQFTALVTDSTGSTNNWRYNHPAAADGANFMIPMTPDAGCIGVSQIIQASWNVSTGTAGNFGLTIARRIATFAPEQGTGVWNVRALEYLTQIGDNACLALAALQGASTTTAPQGDILVARG